MALSSFQKEFKAARDRGDKEFDFGGKKYNTKYKEETSAPAKSSAIAARPASTETREAPAPRESAIAAANDQISPAPSTPKKEYYRSVSGKMVEKTPTREPDEESGFLGKKMREAMGSSYKKGGSVSSASSRADGIAQRGKTRGKMC